MLEPGPCVAGYGLAVLLFGGHPGHGHQGFALYQHQPVPAALLHGPEGEVHQLGELGCPLLGAEGDQPRPLQLQAEVPGLVVIGGQAAINALGGQVLPQALSRTGSGTSSAPARPPPCSAPRPARHIGGTPPSGSR